MADEKTEVAYWVDAVQQYTVEYTVSAFLDGFDQSYDVPGLVAAYRDAINDELSGAGAGIVLRGDVFYGGYPATDDVLTVIREAIDRVDLSEIAERFDTAG